ncbi:hypothetical protein [Pseudomonas sp.]|uniref:hypothetical protein n=1 Tax=Pseudomonas sp. TaxID=306 RepID=UPI002FC63C97
MGYSNASTSERLDMAIRDNGAWADRAVLQAKLSTADQQLAKAQAIIMQGVAIEVTKREVIYRDRIKDPAVRGCVGRSGLFELIDAANGIDIAKH